MAATGLWLLNLLDTPQHVSFASHAMLAATPPPPRAQAGKKAELCKAVPRWLAQDGSVLIISYGVFCNAVKEPAADTAAAAAAARLGRAVNGKAAGGSFTAATGSRLTSPAASTDEAAAAAADGEGAGEGGNAAAAGGSELMPPLRRRSKTSAELDEVRACGYVGGGAVC